MLHNTQCQVKKISKNKSATKKMRGKTCKDVNRLSYVIYDVLFYVKHNMEETTFLIGVSKNLFCWQFANLKPIKTNHGFNVFSVAYPYISTLFQRYKKAVTKWLNDWISCCELFTDELIIVLFLSEIRVPVPLDQVPQRQSSRLWSVPIYKRRKSTHTFIKSISIACLSCLYRLRYNIIIFW